MHPTGCQQEKLKDLVGRESVGESKTGVQILGMRLQRGGSALGLKAARAQLPSDGHSGTTTCSGKGCKCEN